MAKKTSQLPQPTYQDYLERFPEVELPVIITDALQRELEKVNKPFPELIQHAFVEKADRWPRDEFTEYLPGFKVTTDKNFDAVVFWKAGLMSYEYILATYSPKGELISSEIIAKMNVGKNSIAQSATVISADWIIYVVEGQLDLAETDEFDPANTVSYNFEVLPSGEIIKYGEEEFLS